MTPYRMIRLVWVIVLLATFSHTVAARCWKTSRGIIVSVEEGRACAMEAFQGTPDGTAGYADMLNSWRTRLDTAIRLWNIIVPTSASFLLPDESKGLSAPQHPVILQAYASVGKGVETVDVWDTLSAHAQEPIYARTDHHWLPLGAYYAARTFAAKAGVLIPDTADYERLVIRRFNGTMGRWSGSSLVRNTTEDFVWYRPTDSVQIATTYLNHHSARGQVTVSGEPYGGSFFLPRRDGSSSAYSTFMNGDARTTLVRYAAASNQRRLLIIKDSYGNAFASFLLRSFAEVHVVDFRYFQGNILDYIRRAGITDVLVINNLQHAYNPSTPVKILRLLEAPSTGVEEVIFAVK